ncbi:hypothetical protein G6F57_010046 [Rhizopus arrhizus]|uniref:Uncharacterized protein n=1 Tax=Rhizopus oryzae TaxID=64495 RepID=A0A9P6X239_RHIOR|nr:hypothetical protein G6F23_006004 [Rhizopus arrhizus]KAG1414151.1 hypothetical protein G6F58_007102 [Rhizopus delemar]KAG0758222.1 hypothetical protein G6F24_009947 [Rhizopus arrhizus]KAG0792612.1 hypothetical protein G6F22_005820 [Rhizopus arrhizus]KAG0795399.1 hypothetical protein G6F21_002125 [Rhizopus arrhizus]
MTVCLPSKDNVPYVQWINTLFGVCVYGTQDTISLLLGYSSIFFWLNAQLPQVIKNYKMSSADGLSIKFLSIWLAGDAANLIGALLTDQLPFQLYLGFYFVSIDICLLSQWIYYNKFKSSNNEEYVIIPQQEDIVIHKPTLASDSLFQHPVIHHTPMNINSTQVVIDDESTPFSSSASPSKWYALSSKENAAKLMSIFLFTLNTAQSSASFTSTQDGLVWIGRISAWICTLLYLMSRIPQILKNRCRQSVEGLSASLFIFAACANFAYTSSILSHPGQTVESLLEALPYLIGSSDTHLLAVKLISIDNL